MRTMADIVPRIPQEIVDEVLGYLATYSNRRSLQSCALVSKPWIPSCRRHLFRNISFTSREVARWLETFPVPEGSPARHVRCLRLSAEGDHIVPARFFEYTPCFTNVEVVTLFGGWGYQKQLWVPPFWRLPQSATSLDINGNTATFRQIRDVMAQPPNLNDLSLSGVMTFIVVDKRAFLGIGMVLRGRFGGQLRLIGGYASGDAMNMSVGNQGEKSPTGYRGARILYPIFSREGEPGITRN